MSKGYSFTNEPFMAFNKSGEAIFTNWFVHERPLAVNVNQYALKGTVNLSGWLEGKGRNVTLKE